MPRSRRDFLAEAGALLLLPPSLAAAQELACDLAVIGGGTGGCAAALQAARSGLRVVLSEATDWIGGQLTSQAVPPDECQGRLPAVKESDPDEGHGLRRRAAPGDAGRRRESRAGADTDVAAARGERGAATPIAPGTRA